MAQTSIHICPVKGGSELHNDRKKNLDYIEQTLTAKNEKYIYPDFPGIDAHLSRIREDYQTAHGKKLHAKATPVREAVVVIEDGTTMAQLRDFCEKARRKWGIEAMQIYTHRDEGHRDEGGVWKPNLHAHIVFNWYDFQSHTTRKLSRWDMTEMQTLLAECLSMERGVSSDRKHLSAIQQKNEAEAAKLERLQLRVGEIEAKHKAELVAECKDLRKSGRQTVQAFDFLTSFDAVKPTQREKDRRDQLAEECSRELPNEAAALSEHALALRALLMNTIAAVSRLGKELQQLAKRIPLFKRSRLAHEANLEARVATAEREMENSSSEAARAIKRAENAEKQANARETQAKLREAAAQYKLDNLEAEIKAARQDGIDTATEAAEHTIRPLRSQVASLQNENAKLKTDKKALQDAVYEAINDHTAQAVNTAKELIEQFGAALFERTGLEFTTYPSWQTAKKELQQAQTQTTQWQHKMG